MIWGQVDNSWPNKGSQWLAKEHLKTYQTMDTTSSSSVPSCVCDGVIWNTAPAANYHINTNPNLNPDPTPNPISNFNLSSNVCPGI